MAAPRSRLYHGWIVAAVCFVIAFFAWGAIFYGHGFFIAALAERHGWPTTLLSSAVASFWLVGIPATMLIGRIIDRHGARWVAVYGALAAGGGITAIGLVDEPWQLFLVYPLLGSAYPALATATISGALVPWFDRRLGLALGLALTGASIGGAVVVPVMVTLSEGRGLTSTLAGIGLVIVVVIVPLALGLLRRPDSAAETSSERGVGAGSEMAPHQLGIGDFLRAAGFWRISLASALALGAQVGFLTHQIPALEVSIGLTGAAYAVSLTAATAILGRFVLGALATRFGTTLLAAICYLIQAMAIASIAAFDEVVVLYGASALAGLVVGCIVMLPPLLLTARFGGASYGTAYGLANAALFFSVAVAAGATGLLRDLAGGYGPSLWLLVCMHLAAAVVIALPFGAERRRASGV